MNALAPFHRSSPARPRGRVKRAAAAFTLVEIAVTLTLLSFVILASMALIHHDRGLSGQILHSSQIELAGQNLLLSLEHEVANAYGERPIAVAPLGLGAAVKTLQLDSTLGFPPVGTVVIDRGKANEERIDYAALGPGKIVLDQLVRGVQCTEKAPHGAQAEVLWTGLAEPLAQKDPPPSPSSYDGVAMETSGPVYFRGDGTGFSYRVPVGPSGEKDDRIGHELKRGAEVPGGGATLDGWNAIYFKPRITFDESVHGNDVNGDGDVADTFDIGQLRRVTWDTSDSAAPVYDVGIGPATVLQERCNYGGDLDGDGFDDPLFLWDSTTNELHVRLHLISTSRADEPIVRRLESVMFLRNEPEL